MNKNLIIDLSIESTTTMKRWIDQNADELDEGKKLINTAIIRATNKKLYEINLIIEKYAEPEKIDGIRED